MSFTAEHKAFRRNFMLRRRESLCSAVRWLVQIGKQISRIRFD